jgi:hypothetical protein
MRILEIWKNVHNYSIWNTFSYFIFLKTVIKFLGFFFSVICDQHSSLLSHYRQNRHLKEDTGMCGREIKKKWMVVCVYVVIFKGYWNSPHRARKQDTAKAVWEATSKDFISKVFIVKPTQWNKVLMALTSFPAFLYLPGRERAEPWEAGHWGPVRGSACKLFYGVGGEKSWQVLSILGMGWSWMDEIP